MPTAAPPAPAPIQSLQDPRIKEKLQELRLTDNVTNIYYFFRIYLYFALVIGGILWFYHFQASQDLSCSGDSQRAVYFMPTQTT